MYVQLTTRCNMRCAHCCFSCGAEGSDMTLETFRAALDLFPGATVTLGGGEPTLHPLFGSFLACALGTPDVPFVEVLTNGSQTVTALRLAALAREGRIGCTLSLDAYHAPIDPRVVEAFTTGLPTRAYGDGFDDGREVRDVTGQVLRVGRGASAPAAVDGCPCPDLFVTPAGLVRSCGCPDAPIVVDLTARLPGNTSAPLGFVPPRPLLSGRCHREAVSREGPFPFTRTA